MDQSEKECFDACYFVCAEFSSAVDWDHNERSLTTSPSTGTVTSELSHNSNYQHRTQNWGEGCDGGPKWTYRHLAKVSLAKVTKIEQ